MKLWDRVDIYDGDERVAQNVPAAVYVAESVGVTDQAATFIATELRAILPAPDDMPIELDVNDHEISWRGTRYSLDGLPMVRRKRGRDHHQTVTLTTTT